MKTQLWLLYDAKFDVGQGPIPWSMARHAETFNVSFDILYIDYFTIDGDVLSYRNEECRELPEHIFFRGYRQELSLWFEAHGVDVIDTSRTMLLCKDKWKTYEVVESLGIRQPLSLPYEGQDFNSVADSLGIPFVMKDRYGMKGNDVYLISSQKEWDETANRRQEQDFLLQEYISESKGRDCRVYVIGGNPIGAVQRTNDCDFRANVAQGGSFAGYPMCRELIDKAIAINKALDGKVIAIDFLFSDEGFIFCEANTNAGLHAFNKLGYPMTRMIMDYICNDIIKGSKS